MDQTTVQRQQIYLLMIAGLPYQCQVYQHKITGETFAAYKFMARSISKEPDIFYCDESMAIKLPSKPKEELNHIFRHYEKLEYNYKNYFYCVKIDHFVRDNNGLVLEQGVIFKKVKINDIILKDDQNRIRAVIDFKNLGKYYDFIGRNYETLTA